MLKVAKEEKTDITNKINDLTDEIVGLSKSIKSIDEELIDLNLDELEKNKNEIQIKIQKSKDKIVELENRNIELGNQYSSIESEYAHIDIEKLEQNAVKEQEHADYDNLYTNKLERLLIELNNVQEKVDKLHNHEYDPECKYCIENEFVKDALIAKQTINQLYKEKDDIESLIKDNLIKSEPYNNSIMLLADYNSNKSSALKVRADILDIESKIKEFSIFEINATNKINEIESKIKNYNANKESIDFNKKISIEIQKLQDEKNTLSFKLLQLDESISNFTAQIKISDTVLKDAKEKIQRLNSLEQKFKAYELYTKATNRNGVPYNLISDIQNHYNLNEFFNHRLPNYKIQAAFYTLLEAHSADADFNPTVIINNKVTILEHLTAAVITEKQVRDYYLKFAELGVQVVEPPIGKIEPHGRKPIYKIIGKNLDSLVKTN
jgi:hypothetical protein